MPASEARIRANQINAQSSTGPKTLEGKERSRVNAFKHGLTGEGVALPAEDAAEVDRLERAYQAELRPSGEIGRTLVRRMALMTVRMTRAAEQETAHLTDRFHQAEADFDAEWPMEPGLDDTERKQMRAEAAHQAMMMFDSSKPACLARKYEAAAERCFFRSLKELRLVEKAAKAGGAMPEVGYAPPALGSFLPASAPGPVVAAKPVAPVAKPAQPAALVTAPTPNPRPAPVSSVRNAPSPAFGGVFEVPFAIGKAG